MKRAWGLCTRQPCRSRLQGQILPERQMIEFSRRSMLGVAGVTALAAALPPGALAQSAATGAAWDLADLYANDAAWEAERQAVAKLLPSLGEWRGKLGSSPQTLKAALDAI